MDLSLKYSKTSKGAKAVLAKSRALPSSYMLVLSNIDGKTPASVLQEKLQLNEEKFTQALSQLLDEAYIQIVQDFGPSIFDLRSAMEVSEISAEEFFKLELPEETTIKTQEQIEAEERARLYAEEQARKETLAREQEEAERKLLNVTDILAKSGHKIDIEKLAEGETANQSKPIIKADMAARQVSAEDLPESPTRAVTSPVQPTLDSTETPLSTNTEPVEVAADEPKATSDAEKEALNQAEEQARQSKLRQHEEAKRQQKADAARKAEEEAQAKAERIKREEALAQAKHKAEEQARKEAERKAEEEARAEAERIKREEALAQAKRKAEEKAQKEAARRARKEAEVARKQAEQQAREEAKAHARAESERRAKEVAERRAQEKAEADIRARETAERKAQEIAELQAQRAAEAEAKAEAKAEAARKAREEARIRNEQLAVEKAAAKAEARREAGARALLRAEAWSERRANISVLSSTLAKKLKAVGRPLLIGITVISVALLVLLHFVSLAMWIQPVEHAIAANIGEPVKIRDMRISLWPQPHMVLEEVAIGPLADIRANKILVYPVIPTLLKDHKEFDSVEIEGLLIDQEDLQRPGKWLSTAAEQGKLTLSAISIKDLTINSPQLEVPAFNADIQLNKEGLFASASLHSDNIVVNIVPANNVLTVKIQGQGWQPPLGPAITFDELTATGTLEHDQLELRRIEGSLYGGTIQGVISVNWANGWKANGNLELVKIDLGQATPALSEFTTLQGRLYATLDMGSSGNDFASLIDNTSIRARFEAEKGQIGGLDLSRAAAGREQIGGVTRFEQVSGNWVRKDQRHQLTQVVLNAGSLQAQGEINISREQDVSGRIQTHLDLGSRDMQARFNLAGKLGSVRIHK